MAITYDLDKLTTEQRELLRTQYRNVTEKILDEHSIPHDKPDSVSLGTEQVWVRVWLLVDTKEKPNGEKKRWRVTLLRREQVDSSTEFIVEGSNKEEAERNAVQAATSGRIPSKYWIVEDSETEYVKADPGQTEKI